VGQREEEIQEVVSGLVEEERSSDRWKKDKWRKSRQKRERGLNRDSAP
jgi:hypothetical protein